MGGAGVSEVWEVKVVMWSELDLKSALVWNGSQPL